MKYLDVDGVGRVSRIGLGTWQFGSREWGYGDSYASGGARVIVERALELGVTLFDTAEAYGFGKSERILGEALGAARDDVVIASKIFPLAPFAPVIRQRATASAKRLGVSKISLYQVHQPNPVVPDSVIMPGMRSLLDDGTIGAAGVSNYSLNRWLKADAALGRPVISNQVHFSLANPAPLHDLVPFAEREGRIVMAYSPLEQGLLGGKYTRRQPARWRPRRQPVLRQGEPPTRRAAARGAAPDRRRARRQAGPGRARLAAQPAERGGHPRGVERRAARVQRGSRRSRARSGRRRRAHRCGRGLHPALDQRAPW